MMKMKPSSRATSSLFRSDSYHNLCFYAVILLLLGLDVMAFSFVANGVPEGSASARWLLHNVPAAPPNGSSRRRTVVALRASTSPQQTSSLSTTTTTASSPLSLSLQDLTSALGGKGRALAVWECYRRGVDPVIHFAPGSKETQQKSFGVQAYRKLCNLVHNQTLSESVGQLAHQTVAADGTTKLLVELAHDGLQVETVIIPWDNRQSSTLCVSSQVGCRQACRFCLTGRMGLQRSLTADEILVQVVWAQHVVAMQQQQSARSVSSLYDIDNIVFMGMGEPGDNVDAVVGATHRLTHAQQFQFAPRRVVISTVAPTPDAFQRLATAPALIAWSVHASRSDIRHQLVPTKTEHSMTSKRDALLAALLARPSKRMRTCMLEVTLLENINDSVAEAQHLADFVQPLLHHDIPVVVNLIPWNDIGIDIYKQPSMDRILAFQQTLMRNSIRCHIRITRGQDTSAACGQLATANKKQKSSSIDNKLSP